MDDDGTIGHSMASLLVARKAPRAPVDVSGSAGFDVGGPITAMGTLDECRDFLRNIRSSVSGPVPRETGPAASEARIRHLYEAQVRVAKAAGGYGTMAHAWHLRVRYRRYREPERVARQCPFQHPSAMRTGIVYDIQRPRGESKFEVFWVFEDADGVVRWPYLVPDEGIARGAVLYQEAIPQHRMLMAAGEGFDIVDVLGEPIAECEFLELHDEIVRVDGEWTNP